ncbi:acyl carrier protein [Enterovirga rhinocerotis]|uniref:Acyl carrier protein n=1 Tax=Enterovirga rhinocerotis TaxID=1339210 RepID=A0A4R7C879_9HYPH|nr:phosphopantetheine-binding protein [Enterovirga rhinocerotis]TDR94172.1 acyl carrier protein [Enterovirga rhinocerotis]
MSLAPDASAVLHRKATIHRILDEVLGVDRHTLRDDASLVDDLGADSVDLIEIGILLEDEFELDDHAIDVDAFDDSSTVGDVVALVEAKLGAPA